MAPVATEPVMAPAHPTLERNNINYLEQQETERDLLPVIKLICVFMHMHLLLIHAIPGISACMCCLKDLSPEIAPLRHI